METVTIVLTDKESALLVAVLRAMLGVLRDGAEDRPAIKALMEKVYTESVYQIAVTQ